MTTTTSTAEAEAASQQRVQITPDITLTLAILTTHNSSATSASLTGTWLFLHCCSSCITFRTTFRLSPSEGSLSLSSARDTLASRASLHRGSAPATSPSRKSQKLFCSCQNVCENVVINEVGVMEVRSLVWGEEEEEEGEHGDDIHGLAAGDYDIVLISDVFYDMGMMEMLGRTLKRVCGERMRALGTTKLRQWTLECLTVLVKERFELIELGVFGCCHELWTGLEGTAGEHFAVYEFVKKREDDKIVD